ncbi:hypothetical protein [Thermus filiformis]|uniref:Uncharacterized protein n=1 Tax=Thermus filiformis TaxID=276 RepID=A0A0A2WPB1_THEFI|nr:hypothetical protein [Thermus filiformis]KGQ22021.1 hypothetical protein THFILI_05470 [Thermus filiformis]
MESAIEEALSRYMAEAAAKNLLRRAMASRRPQTSREWAELVEGPLWELLRTYLPFRHLPPELKALAANLRAQAETLEEAEEEATTEAEEIREAVDLEDPQARAELAARLARLPGALGVWVQGRTGAEVRGDPLAFPAVAHRLLAGYTSFYVDLEEGLFFMRSLGQGHVALLARKDAGLGQLLQALRRLYPKEEEG